MIVHKTAADVIQNHTTLTVECIDRIYLNVIQQRLQAENGIAWFFRQHRGETFATAKVMSAMTKTFIADVEQFVATRSETSATPLRFLERSQDTSVLAKVGQTIAASVPGQGSCGRFLLQPVYAANGIFTNASV